MTEPCQPVCSHGAPSHNIIAMKSNRAGPWTALIIAVLLVASAFVEPARSFRHRVFSVFRIAKPQPVNVNIPSFSGPNANRQLQDMVSGMISPKVNVTLDEADQPAASAAAAGKAAGFAPQLPRARKDPPALIVTGAHAIQLSVDRGQLRTIFVEAGRPDVPIPASLEGGAVTVRTPRGIRAQYGNCPAPAAATLANQINGPPPPSADNGNCVVLTQNPVASTEAAAGLDVSQLVEIALELSGMSPNQARAFQRTVDEKSALVLSMPRNLRSWDSVTVNGARGMLVNTAGRRGPTWALIWTKNGMVYSLAGYGSSGDAMPLAASLAEAGSAP
jgi:hypothetical protein